MRLNPYLIVPPEWKNKNKDGADKENKTESTSASDAGLARATLLTGTGRTTKRVIMRFTRLRAPAGTSGR